VQYCVGRLHFDTAEDYRRYSESVVAYETAATPANSRELLFFGPRQAGDAPTRLSSEYLVKPLGTSSAQSNILNGIKRKTGVEFTSRLYLPEQSTKACLSEIFHGNGVRTPAFLFTASHGVGWPMDHPQQFAASGALLCQDFRSPGLGPLKPDWLSIAQPVYPPTESGTATDRGQALFCGARQGAAKSLKRRRAWSIWARGTRVAAVDNYQRRGTAIATVRECNRILTHRVPAGLCPQRF
jgi:hypothetical protein